MIKKNLFNKIKNYLEEYLEEELYLENSKFKF